MWSPDAPQGKESAKIRHLTTHYTMGRGLDVGCGSEKIWPSAIGLDSGKQWGKPVADLTGDGSDLSLFADSSLDYVFSSHFLEHTVDFRGTLQEWWRVIKVGGYLAMYLPHKQFYPNCGQPGANADHKWDFMPDDIIQAMPSGFLCCELEERNHGNEYSFFIVFQKTGDGQRTVDPWRKSEVGKNCLVIRYGGYGDIIQAASLCAVLKSEGYHVTFNTTPDKAVVLKHDPNVDDFWLQETDQVPNNALGSYWMALEERYDRIVNLSETCEGALLALPGTAKYAWSDEARHKLLNVNYVEFAHDTAGLPGPYNPRFYASDEELETAREFKSDKPTVAIAMSGSSVQKVWPHVDALINRCPEYTFVLTGAGKTDTGLAQHVEKMAERYGFSDRVVNMVNKWTIRETFAFGLVADAVIGPETGLTNAVGMEDNLKIVFLSHSSPENLTRDWVNTKALMADMPSHRMHYDWTNVLRDEETGAAKCAADITAEAVADILKSEL